MPIHQISINRLSFFTKEDCCSLLLIEKGIGYIVFSSKHATIAAEKTAKIDREFFMMRLQCKDYNTPFSASMVVYFKD